jgi:hypothetical protein
MSAHAYHNILSQIDQLTLEEQQQLLQDIANVVQRHQVTSKPQRSILEFEGLGKEIWEGIDVDRYIEEERNSWDG